VTSSPSPVALMKYDHQNIESKWQKRWEETKLYQPDLDKAKNPFYNLMMFPYPSADKLHAGNVYAFTGADSYGRFKRLQGFDVFEPMGLDAFGIHGENYALKVGRHPGQVHTEVAKFYREQQLSKIGNMFDWTHEVDTTDPAYYKWTQWLFIQLFKKGLAVRKKAAVNWCPKCLTVLSDEQVENGVCERCKTTVDKKLTEQWFFKITQYAQRLLDNLDWIDWSEKTKTAQKNWIGRSEGVNFHHKVKDMDIEFEVFDSIPQTHLAQTFVIIAPEHPMVEKLVEGTKQEKLVLEFVEKMRKKKLAGNFDIDKDMEGIFTGRYSENYLGTGRDLPIWVASFAVMDYGTGIVACSAHDERDFTFAKKYDIPLRPVLLPKDKKLAEKVKNAEVFYREPDGIMQEPEQFLGMTWEKAREPIIDYLEENGLAKRIVNYRLRDWCISRQRYWGPPIPMILCEKCGWQPVPEEDLPVLLPETDDYIPDNSGKSPLARNEEFVNTTCPKCGGPAKRETDVSDTFLDSAWYFFRYPSTDFADKVFDQKRTKKWLPVDMYIGGNEHAVLHLMYTRFITMVLHDLGLIDFDEPFKKFRAHGLLIKDGAKMSKSRGNVVNPDEYIKKHGADALRIYLLFLGPYDQGGDFRDSGMGGMVKFLNRFYTLIGDMQKKENSAETIAKLHQTIKKVSDDTENLHFNTAIAAIMEMTNKFYDDGGITAENAKILIKLIAPFCPHSAEELWEHIEGEYSVFNQPWPLHDPELAKEDEIELVVQVNGKIRAKLVVSADISEADALRMAKEDEKIKGYLEGKKIIKEFFVEGKLVSLVVG